MDREAAFSSTLARRNESIVVVLPFRPADSGPNLWAEFLDTESHARPAAFEEAAGVAVLRAPKDLGDFEGFFPSFVRKVVSIRLLFSGLGVLDFGLGCAGGAGSAGGGYGRGEPMLET